MEKGKGGEEEQKWRRGEGREGKNQSTEQEDQRRRKGLGEKWKKGRMRRWEEEAEKMVERMGN